LLLAGCGSGIVVLVIFILAGRSCPDSVSLGRLQSAVRDIYSNAFLFH
jgi:hypothetical protein